MKFNINIGVLGHVDSGKTSLVKSISTIASTACYDKAKQSQERKITLDLGFSSLELPVPSHLSDVYTAIQVTLVDCPGHASLIRTIIGGAQIIDLMLLVIDATKGFQTQTAECLVLAEILCNHMIIVLNKIDQLNSDKRDALILKMQKKISKTIDSTKFFKCPIVPVSANCGTTEDGDVKTTNLDDLIAELSKMIFVPERSDSGDFIMAIDHCFAIRGQGTILTGTILGGCVHVNDSVEIFPAMVTKKVKSMQSFKQQVDKAMQGDRLGLCVTNFEASLLERGSAASPGSLKVAQAVIASFHKVKYYQRDISSKSKLHISIAHETTMATLTLFACEEPDINLFNPELEYCYVETLPETNGPHSKSYFVLLEFDKPLVCPKKAILIGSKLDTDIHLNICRIAFYGQAEVLLSDTSGVTNYLAGLKICKYKSKMGKVERMVDERTVIVKELFKKESDLKTFDRLSVELSTGEKGVIVGSFGQSGKVKIDIPGGLCSEALEKLSDLKKKSTRVDLIDVTLNFKKYPFDKRKQISQ